MANFTITYAFVALDSFTKTAAKISVEIDSIEAALEKMAITSNVANEALTTMGGSSTKAVDALNMMSPTIIKGATNVGKLRDETEKAAKSSAGFAAKIGLVQKKISEYTTSRTGVSSFYRAMNIVLPMVIIAKLGLDYQNSMEGANIALHNQYNQSKDQVKQIKLMNQLASKYSQITPFSAPQIMESGVTSANILGNVGAAKDSLKAIMEYAEITHQKLPAATTDFFAGIRAGGLKKIDLPLTARTNVGKLEQVLAYFAKIFPKVIEQFEKQPQTKIMVAAHNLQKVFGQLVVTLEPAIAKVATGLNDLALILIPLIKKHQKLVEVIGAVIAASLAWVVVETIFMTALKAVGIVLLTIVKALEIFGVTSEATTAGFAKFAKVSSLAEAIAMITPEFLVLAGIITLVIKLLYDLYENHPAIGKEIKKGYQAVTKAVMHPEKTAEAFFSHHLGKQPTSRLGQSNLSKLFKYGSKWSSAAMEHNHTHTMNIKLNNPNLYVASVRSKSSTTSTTGNLGNNMGATWWD